VLLEESVIRMRLVLLFQTYRNNQIKYKTFVQVQSGSQEREIRN
jgi:hypothetical protein